MSVQVFSSDLKPKSAKTLGEILQLHESDKARTRELRTVLAADREAFDARSSC